VVVAPRVCAPALHAHLVHALHAMGVDEGQGSWDEALALCLRSESAGGRLHLHTHTHIHAHNGSKEEATEELTALRNQIKAAGDVRHKFEELASVCVCVCVCAAVPSPIQHRAASWGAPWGSAQAPACPRRWAEEGAQRVA
jgi:hypothetical protein